MKRSVFAKIATLALALVLVLSLAACGKKSDSGVKILVPNDTTNEARALLLLQENGIITLKDGAGITATKNDIVDNPYNVGDRRGRGCSVAPPCWRMPSTPSSTATTPSTPA